MMNIEKTIKTIIAEQIDIDVNTIKNDQHLFKDLGFDSTDFILVCLLIEEKLDIYDVPDDLPEPVVGSMIDYYK